MAASAKTPSELIDARITGLGDWCGRTLAKIRKLKNPHDLRTAWDEAASCEPSW